MARRKEDSYVFTPGGPGAGTIKIPGHLNLSDLLTIINTTTGNVIYAPNDPGKGALRGHAHPQIGADPDFPYSIDGTCTFTFDFDTSSMSASDDLLILIEDERKGLTIRPYDAAVDAIERMKVSQPESLIDADFEYGLQASKWQNVGFNLAYPSFSEPTGNPLPVNTVSSNGASPISTISVNLDNVGGIVAPQVGSAIFVSGLVSGAEKAEGLFIVSARADNQNFQYEAKGNLGIAAVSATPYTTIREAAIFDQAPLDIESYSTVNGSSTVTLTFNSPHGLFPGSPFFILDNDVDIPNLEGPFFVGNVINDIQFEYTGDGNLLTTGTVTNTATPGRIVCYAVSNAIFTHRPFDGGVLINSFYPIAGLEAKRQTKRYFRYQSGKGIQFATGTQFQPVYDITSVSNDGSDVTIVTDIAHGLQVGVQVVLDGIESTGYNNDNTDYNYASPYTVTAITGENSFQIATSQFTAIPGGAATLGTEPQVVAIKWKGAAVRVGTFDDANGPYWEYNGDKLFACIRSSTTQCIGTVALTDGSNKIVGTDTAFGQQFVTGNKVLIRGQVYEIQEVRSPTVMYVNPAYRGAGGSNVKMGIIRDIRVPQSQFNIDTIDGHGPSGYNIHLDRMQMMGIQWSWYGAGYVDYQVRGPLGEYITVHRMANANFKREAYMRTGNLPARYETVTSCRHSKVITNSTGTGTADITIANADKLFPTDGGILLLKSGNTGDTPGNTDFEMISYTSISGNTVSGIGRTATYTRYLNGSDRTFSCDGGPYDHPVGTGVQFVDSNIAPSVSHWGSSVVMDGGFGEDAGFRFTVSNKNVTVAAGATQTILSFRPAPAVSNTLVGNVGERELINRSRVNLQSIEINNVGDAVERGSGANVTVVYEPRRIEIAGILNPTNTELDPQTLTWSNCNTVSYGSGSTAYQPSFSQYNDLETTAPSGGELLFKFATSAESDLFDISTVKELQNSILGGNGLFPNGPEMIVIAVTNNSDQDTTVDIVLSWKEAQA